MLEFKIVEICLTQGPCSNVNARRKSDVAKTTLRNPPSRLPTPGQLYSTHGWGLKQDPLRQPDPCTLTVPGTGSSWGQQPLPVHVLPQNSLDEGNQEINGFSYHYFFWSHFVELRIQLNSKWAELHSVSVMGWSGDPPHLQKCWTSVWNGTHSIYTEPGTAWYKTALCKKLLYCNASGIVTRRNMSECSRRCRFWLLFVWLNFEYCLFKAKMCKPEAHWCY